MYMVKCWFGILIRSPLIFSKRCKWYLKSFCYYFYLLDSVLFFNIMPCGARIRTNVKLEFIRGHKYLAKRKVCEDLDFQKKIHVISWEQHACLSIVFMIRGKTLYRIIFRKHPLCWWSPHSSFFVWLVLGFY